MRRSRRPSRPSRPPPALPRQRLRLRLCPTRRRNRHRRQPRTRRTRRSSRATGAARRVRSGQSWSDAERRRAPHPPPHRTLFNAPEWQIHAPTMPADRLSRPTHTLPDTCAVRSARRDRCRSSSSVRRRRWSSSRDSRALSGARSIVRCDRQMWWQTAAEHRRAPSDEVGVGAKSRGTNNLGVRVGVQYLPELIYNSSCLYF